MNADEAKAAIVQLLDLYGLDKGDGVPWEDVVYYVAKSRSTTGMAIRTVERRHKMVANAIGVPEDTGWMDLVRQLKR